MMDDDTKKAIIGVGVAVGVGAVVSALTIDLGIRKETKRLHNEYVTKWKKLGPVVSLFEELGEWIGEPGKESASARSSQDFLEGFLERAEYLGIACRALSDDLPKEDK